MRILTTLVLAAILSLAAAAQPVAPADLAAYVPPDVLLYVEFSTTDSAVQGIDSLIGNLTARIGVEPPPTFDGIVEILGLRTWLGGKGAFAVLPPAGGIGVEQNVIGLLQIRSRAEVENFLLDQANATEVPTIGIDASTYLVGGISVSVTDELVIAAAGLAGATVPAPGMPSLAGHQPYLDALAALPGEDYAATAYLDPRGLVFAVAATEPEFIALSAINLPALTESLGVWSAGIARLDDRSYAIDAAHLYGERHIFEALYAAAPPVIESAPINPDWLAILPDDVAFAGQFSRPWAQVKTLLDAFSAGGNALRTRALFNQRLLDGLDLDPIRNPAILIPPSISSAAIVNTLEGLLNMTDAELTAAFDGQAAVALRVRAAEGTPALDVLFAAESAGLDESHAILNGVRSVLPLIDVFPVEAGDDVLVFEAPGGPYQSRIELLADFNAFYAGSESLVLAGKETFAAVPRLTESEPFVHDRALFLPGATNLAYVHLPPLRELFGTRTVAGEALFANAAEARTLLDTFDSFWISARTEPSRTVARIAFTLTQ